MDVKHGNDTIGFRTASHSFPLHERELEYNELQAKLKAQALSPEKMDIRNAHGDEASLMSWMEGKCWQIPVELQFNWNSYQFKRKYHSQGGHEKKTFRTTKISNCIQFKRKHAKYECRINNKSPRTHDDKLRSVYMRAKRAERDLFSIILLIKYILLPVVFIGTLLCALRVDSMCVLSQRFGLHRLVISFNSLKPNKCCDDRPLNCAGWLGWKPKIAIAWNQLILPQWGYISYVVSFCRSAGDKFEVKIYLVNFFSYERKCGWIVIWRDFRDENKLEIAYKLKATPFGLWAKTAACKYITWLICNNLSENLLLTTFWTQNRSRRISFSITTKW